MTIKKLIRKLALRVKTMIWALPPAGGFINPFQVLYFALLNGRGNLALILQEKYPNHELFFLNSAKSALYLAYGNIKIVTGKDIVAMPAYTCPDVASSAVRAGLRLWLLDFEQERKLRIACPPLVQANIFACTVGTNLFGVDDSSALHTFSSELGIFHIEDVCQAALSNFNGRVAGVCENSIGLMSFGRGKAYSSAGGGLLLIPKTPKHQALISEMHYQFREVPKAHFVDNLLYALKSFLFWLLERPNLYWMVRLLPFTGLGETNVKIDFPLRKASTMELAAMVVSVQNRETYREQKLKILSFYRDENDGQVNEIKDAVIRLPLILNEEIILKLTKNYKLFMSKYGISLSYPNCIDAYRELKDYVVNKSTQRAVSMAGSIVTLPTHKYVRKSNVKKIFSLIRELKRESNV